VYILPLLPLLILLGGMILVWALPDKWNVTRDAQTMPDGQGSLRDALALPDKPLFGQIKRWIYTLALGGTLASFLTLYGLHATEFSYQLWPSTWFPMEALVLAPDALSVILVVLFVGLLFVVSMSMLVRPMERFESVTMLCLVAVGLGTFVAANLLTLALLWAITDVVLLIMALVRAPPDSVARVTRAIFGSVMSAIALLGAAMLTILEGGQSGFAGLNLSVHAARLMMVAAGLRLGVYPLPGSLTRRWEVLLISVCTGGYLWLRLGSLTGGSLPGADWLVPLLGWLLMVIGLLAVLAQDLSSALPLVFGSGIASLVLAGLLGPGSGLLAALLITINLGVSLAMVLVDAQVRPIPPWGRNARLPLIVGLASAVGWPLTLGFSAHWILFKSCWSSGARIIILQASLGYLMVSVPIWQRFRQVLREIRSAGPLPRWQISIALAGASLGGLFLIGGGVVPGLWEWVWAHWRGLQEAGLQTAGLPAQLPGNRAVMVITLVATAAVVPFLGSYALQRLWGHRRPGRLSRIGKTLEQLLELDWLYAEIQGLLGHLTALVEYLSIGIEEVFFLGWSLIWVLVIILYLA